MWITQYFKGLQFNIRAYFLGLAVLVSILVVSVLRLTIPSDQLFYIRTQQIYGLIAVLLLYGAVILTPLSKLFPKKSWMSVLLFARRAIGVSAAYFTILHTLIALLDQVGGIANLNLLPKRFIVAFVMGGIATLILLAMAATSFDVAIKKMTFKRWKQLHQLVYIAGIFIIVHVWLIGTHADITAIRLVALIALGTLFALESYRLVGKYAANLGSLQQKLAGVAVFAMLFGSLWLLPIFAGNYHSEHDSETYTTEPSEVTP